jgi:hypothetical protein
MSNPLSTTDPAFRDRVISYFNTTFEILILVRYSRAAGAKDFRLFSSVAAVESLLNPLPVSTSVTVFKDPGLSHRGIVDELFVVQCLASIAEGAEYLVLDIESNDFRAGETHDELRADLKECLGHLVAVGPYPPFCLDSDEIITAYVPDQNGVIKIGVY